MPPDPSADQARAAIQAALGQTGFCLPRHHHHPSRPVRQAPLRLRGRPAVPARPLHPVDPHRQGKTVTRLLTPAQYQAYAPWFANTRRLRALAAELEALSLQEMARAEGWATITPGSQAPARTKLVRVPKQPITGKTPGDQPA